MIERRWNFQAKSNGDIISFLHSRFMLWLTQLSTWAFPDRFSRIESGPTCLGTVSLEEYWMSSFHKQCDTDVEFWHEHHQFMGPERDETSHRSLCGSGHQCGHWAYRSVPSSRLGKLPSLGHGHQSMFIISFHLEDFYIFCSQLWTGFRLDDQPYPMFSHVFPCFPMFSHVFPCFPTDRGTNSTRHRWQRQERSSCSAGATTAGPGRWRKSCPSSGGPMWTIANLLWFMVI